MPTTFTELPLSAFDLDLLLDDPRLDFFEPADDWRAFHGDMWVVPVNLPSATEVLAMAHSLGLSEPPF